MDIIEIEITSPKYPELLKLIPNPPKKLYCIGDISLLNTKCVAIVGSREPSRYGEEVTEKFAAGLAKAGVTVVSGLAYGIDAIAHRTVLKEGGKTVGVLGCGIDVIYPVQNANLYKEMYQKGLVISEYPQGTKPNQYQFPERNRIISGLCKGVLVAEAREKSGSLITADCATEQGRDLFIIPSAITSKRGEGGNNMLKLYPQAFVTDPSDILGGIGVDAIVNSRPPKQLDYTESLLVEALSFKDLHFDEILQLTQIPLTELNALLTKLGLFGVLKKLDNNYYGLQG